MGVPKFFRYINERYPCLSELIRENQVPEFDNMYLDMNGIIHNCSHPDDGNVHFRITEEQIFKDIFYYLEALFMMIKPKKLFFMAIDGVAPRAKMNQQRGRRFCSAKDAEMLEAKAKEKGETLPTEARFDSNCITPGTPFMVRLHEALKYFVQYKVTNSAAWRQCKIILSGHETPGEGEHKIMEYIRFMKAQPGFDPNTRHCLYGLDADLIMLGLCTHERHFSLLREEVKFGKKSQKKSGVNETRFYLLHLSLLRDYLELEFFDLKTTMEFQFDIEKIIDDWVLMGFLVGNDFIPNIPNLHINTDALPYLYKAYIKTLPTLGGYINEGGNINLTRLQAFFENLSDFDRNIFESQYDNFQYMEEKQAQNSNARNDETFGDIGPSNCDLDEMIMNTELEFALSESSLSDDDPELFEKQYEQHRRDYYVNKLKYQEMTPDVLEEQAKCYIYALQWTLSYYYHGVQSWGWYYPHHYAPFISDLKNFKDFEIKFEMGKPFLPFQQLLSVLPAASSALIPDAYKHLMSSPDSEIIDYYPKNFDTDLNGKKQEWEAVVLIPFIDENRLLNAMRKCDSQLSPEERSRNIHGPMLVYTFNASGQRSLQGPGQSFPDIGHVLCNEDKLHNSDLHVPKEKLVLGPSEGAFRDYYYPGFPTMKHLNYTRIFDKKGVRVFDAPSRNDNLIVCLEEKSTKDTPQLADDLLGKVIYVGWPHLFEARVTKVIDAQKTYSLWDGILNTEREAFDMQRKAIKDHHLLRMGIDVGDVSQIVKVVGCTGDEYVYDSNTKSYKHNKTWSRIESSYPAQTVIEDIKAFRQKFKEVFQVVEVYKPGTIVFMQSSSYYGSMGEVLDTSNFDKTGRIKVTLTVYTEPNLTKAKEITSTSSSSYMNSYQAACHVGISVNAFNRVTGVVPVIAGEKRQVDVKTVKKTNIGLQLKFSKQNEELVGYTKKINDRTWLYSLKVVEIIKNYYNRLPQLFKVLEKLDNNSAGMIFEGELFGDSEDSLSEICKWLKELPHQSAERRTAGNELIDKEVVEEVVRAADKTMNEPFKKIQLQIKPHLLFLPELHKTSKMPDPDTNFELFDRVVIAKQNDKYPLGTRGTVIGIHQVKDPNPVRQEHKDRIDRFCEILFDIEFDCNTSVYGIAENRIGRVIDGNLLNITFGRGDQEFDLTKQVADKSKAPQQKQQQPQGPKFGESSFAKVVDTSKSGFDPKKQKIQILKNVHQPAVAVANNKKEATPPADPPKTDNQVDIEISRKLQQIALSSNMMKSPVTPQSADDRFQDLWSGMKNGGSASQPPAQFTEKSLKEILKIDSSNGGSSPRYSADVSSDSLKNLLGISGSRPVIAESPGKPISVNDLFAMKNMVKHSDIELPAPPKEWVKPEAEQMPDTSRKFFTENQSANENFNANGDNNKTYFQNNQKWDPQKRFRTYQHVQQQQQIQQVLSQTKSPINVTASLNTFVPLQTQRKTTKCNKNQATGIERPRPVKKIQPDVVDKPQPQPPQAPLVQTKTEAPQNFNANPTKPSQKAAVVKKSRLALKFPVNP